MPSSNDPSPTRMPLVVCGMTLASLLAVIYVVCVAWCLALPRFEMYQVWAPLLPGFSWLSWPSFLLGLAETFAFGWFIAIVYVPLRDFFQERLG